MTKEEEEKKKKKGRDGGWMEKTTARVIPWLSSQFPCYFPPPSTAAAAAAAVSAVAGAAEIRRGPGPAHCLPSSAPVVVALRERGGKGG